MPKQAAYRLDPRPEPPRPKPTCGAKGRQTGEPCQKQAGWGTTHPGYGHCKFHGGSTPNGVKMAAKLQAAVNGEWIAQVMGFPEHVDPFDALLEAIWIAKGEVTYCSQRIAELDEGDAVVLLEEVTQTTGVVRGETEESISVKKSSAAELNVWIRTRQEAVDRMARYAKMAIDAGIAERQVVLAERVGGMIGRLVAAVLDDLGLSEGQRELAPVVVRRHLTAIATGSAA